MYLESYSASSVFPAAGPLCSRRLSRATSTSHKRWRSFLVAACHPRSPASRPLLLRLSRYLCIRMHGPGGGEAIRYPLEVHWRRYSNTMVVSCAG